jgi:hypothetical protein
MPFLKTIGRSLYRFDDFVNEPVTVEESNRVRQGFLFLTIKRLDLRIL